MRDAAATDGYDLCHVGAYRPYEQQLSLFKERYVKGDSGDPRKITRKFENEVWMLKKGMAPAGSPGTSNHGWGLAIDVALKVGGKIVQITVDPDGKKGPLDSGLDWLFANADKFGYSWEIKEGAQAEAWHIRYYCGDKIPQAVADWKAAQPVPAAKKRKKPQG
jgi:LAS superfamily LD-carboxypeptidase LdcB